MINNLLTETKNYIHTDAYYASMQTIAKFYQFNGDEEGMLIGRTNALLLGSIKEENFLGELMSELEIPEAKAKSLEERIKKEIIAPFKQKLITMLSGIPDVPTTSKPQSVVGFNASTDTLRQAPQVQPVRPQEPMTKEHILSQIENPPRTVIKRYVIEHEQIEDAAHLIDDKIDNRPKLQDHYTQ